MSGGIDSTVTALMLHRGAMSWWPAVLLIEENPVSFETIYFDHKLMIPCFNAPLTIFPSVIFNVSPFVFFTVPEKVPFRI
jgi:hypothetical protein